MARHSRTARTRARAAVTVGIIGLLTVTAVGVAQAADDDKKVGDTPCGADVRACVDLEDKVAWLIDDGEVVRGPAKISPGSEARPTPTGEFHVQWKDRNHLSREFDNRPMPFAVFFADGGIAFHEGNLNSSSAGCVRLSADDAKAFYDFLQPGDPVEVH
jgi:lipoprotein-anchoring transpeptidase ErfK/SrfK